MEEKAWIRPERARQGQTRSSNRSRSAARSESDSKRWRRREASWRRNRNIRVSARSDRERRKEGGFSLFGQDSGGICLATEGKGKLRRNSRLDCEIPFIDFYSFLTWYSETVRESWEVGLWELCQVLGFFIFFKTTPRVASILKFDMTSKISEKPPALYLWKYI